MKNILYIQSSPRGSESYSQKVAQSIIDELTGSYPDANVTVRNLAQNPPPHVSEAFVGGISAGPEQHTPEQAAALALSDVLIDELLAADVILFSCPMHNFRPPSPLKPRLYLLFSVGRPGSY